MLSLFKPKPVLSDDELAWLYDTVLWAMEHFDGSYLLANGRSVLPTNADFPGQAKSHQELAELTFKHVLHHAGLSQWPFYLTAQSASMSPPSVPLASVQRGTNVSLNTHLPVVCNFHQLKQPQDMVASFAHQIAVHLIMQRGVLPPGGEAMLRGAADVVASLLGFGVMVTNTVYQFRGGCAKCYDSRANRAAFLTESQALGALVMADLLTQSPPKETLRHLKGHLRSSYKRLYKHMQADTQQGAHSALLFIAKGSA